MKVYCKEITLNTDKNVKDTKIVCFSDLHYSKKLNKKILPYLYSKICDYNPDYICFVGDLLNDDSFEEVYNYINYLRYIAPVILIDGNHDIRSFLVDDRIHDNKNHILSEELKIKIGTIPNVYYLNGNSTMAFDNLSFTGTDFYHNTREEDNINFLNNNIPDINKEDYNVLLCHSPYIITKKTFKELDDKYKSFDVAITGHIHNALMPAYIDNKIKANIGLFTVDTGFFPTDYLGEKKIELDNGNEITRINVPPIRTFNGDSPVVQIANKFYPPSIRLVKIKKN